ncbi:MAG: hydrogenase maturation nickel metallochaperone HypA [Synergistaceae bacterium]|nr:hydrogenase maturation nickel metallochaperone HypA [Synergistaceae bacterium]
MYEFQLTSRINNTIQDICWRFSFRKVNRVLIKAGAMRKINPELMTFIFASLSRGTPAEGASFSVMFIPATFRCHDCGRTWTTDDSEFLCIHCGSRDVDLLTGLEFAIDFLEVES